MSNRQSQLDLREAGYTQSLLNARTRQFAKSNDPATWCDFPTALKAYESGRYSGIGFAFAEGDGLFGVDLDHVIDQQTGVIEAWAIEIIRQFQGTYIELSPSGTGLRIFGKGKPERCGKGTKEKRNELYDYTSPRYLTETGHRYV